MRQNKVFKLNEIHSVEMKVMLVFCVVILAGISLGCTKQSFEGTFEQITISTSRDILNLPVWIAEEQGFFVDEGIVVTIKEATSGKEAIETMLADEADIAIVAPAPIVLNSFIRNDFKIISGVAYTHENIKLISYARTVAELKGKKIGLTKGTTAQYYLDVCLTYYGQRSDSVELVDMKPAELPAALEIKKVDAVVVWQPFTHRAQQIKGTTNACNSLVYRTALSAVARDDTNQEAITRFLKAIDRASAFINDDPQSREMAVKILRLDRQIIDDIWTHYTYGLYLDQTLLSTLENEALWATKNNITQAVIPDYRQYMSDILLQVKPDAVTIG